MSSKLDEFKEFVKQHPLLKEDVSSKKKTWQNIYEEWFFDSSESNWSKYKVTIDDNSEKESTDVSNNSGDDLLKNVMAYVKKLDTNSINKSIDSVQKIIGLMSTFANSGIGKKEVDKKVRDPLFDRRFDDWY